MTPNVPIDKLLKTVKIINKIKKPQTVHSCPVWLYHSLGQLSSNRLNAPFYCSSGDRKEV